MVDSGQADLDDWRQRLEENGIAWVRARSISGLEAKHKAAALAVIAEYEQKQEDIRNIPRDKREADLVKYTKIAAISAALAVVVSLWALGKSYGG